MSSENETGEALDARQRFVEWARGELGEQDPNKYYRIAAPQFADKGAEHSVSWCGVFCLAGLIECGFTDWQWVTGKGFVFRLERTTDPQPGDIAVFRKGADGKDIWHHAIVEQVREYDVGDGLTVSRGVATIDGNTMRLPKEGVTAKTHPIDDNATFYSIGSLLRDARAKQDTLPDPLESDTEPAGPP